MSTQILTAHEAFGITTIAAHQGVGSMMYDITLKLFMCCNSACTFGLRARVYS